MENALLTKSEIGQLTTSASFTRVWSHFTQIKAITMKCTYLYNHAICFNQTLHKLGKQSELSNYTGKIDDL